MAGLCLFSSPGSYLYGLCTVIRRGGVCFNARESIESACPSKIQVCNAGEIIFNKKKLISEIEEKITFFFNSNRKKTNKNKSYKKNESRCCMSHIRLRENEKEHVNSICFFFKEK
jgi:hypothetical protein